MERHIHKTINSLTYLSQDKLARIDELEDELGRAKFDITNLERLKNKAETTVNAMIRK